MTILVTGASGFAGAALIPRLQRAGHAVRGFGRSRARIAAAGARPDEVVIGDALSGAGLPEALGGVDVAYYLIHSMEPGSGDFAERERTAAANFAAAASAAGVRRVVYLGVVVPAGNRHSSHVESRHAVENELTAAAPELAVLRASIAIDARSRSFRFLVRLVERVPVMPLPSWREHRTQPVDGRDVIASLLAAGTTVRLDGVGHFDIAGPEVVSYGELIDRIRDLMLIARPSLGLPVSMTPVASAVAAAITGEDRELIRPLMEGLVGDMLPDDPSGAVRLGVRLHSLDSAIEHALGEWERHEPLTAR